MFDAVSTKACESHSCIIQHFGKTYKFFSFRFIENIDLEWRISKEQTWAYPVPSSTFQLLRTNSIFTPFNWCKYFSKELVNTNSTRNFVYHVCSSHKMGAFRWLMWSFSDPSILVQGHSYIKVPLFWYQASSNTCHNQVTDWHIQCINVG